jgi:hypothetical protein
LLKVALAAAHPWRTVEELVYLIVGPLNDRFFLPPFSGFRQAETDRKCYEEKNEISAGNKTHNAGPDIQVGQG